jgi:predicted nucleotidyltransferase component of viral defense system
MIKVKNIPASVRQRLLNLSREKGEDFNLLLTRFALERLLYRLGESSFSDQFILKGPCSSPSG